jgi:hypothetical protein
MGSLPVHRRSGGASAGPVDRSLADRRGGLVRVGLADVLVAGYGFALTPVVASYGPLWLVGWLAGCLAALLPGGLVVYAATAFGYAATGVAHNSVVLAGLLAVILLFPRDQWRQLVKIQATVVYLFAALNKLWPNFLSGGVLSSTSPWLPCPELVAPLVVVVEGWLAWLVWVESRWALPAAVMFHLGVTFGTRGSTGMAGIIGFNLALVVMVWFATPSRRQTRMK